jgi:argininosuccinate lyase
MVVYTHRKEAQPITLGHYLVAISECLGKNLDRDEELYKRINQCPLGAATTAGTGWPINRQRTAELLGFDALVICTNTLPRSKLRGIKRKKTLPRCEASFGESHPARD